MAVELNHGGAGSAVIVDAVAFENVRGFAAGDVPQVHALVQRQVIRRHPVDSVLAVWPGHPPHVAQIRFPVVILEHGRVADLAPSTRVWLLKVKGPSGLSAVAIPKKAEFPLSQEHDVLSGRVVVEHVHSVGVSFSAERHALVGPMDQIGGLIAGLVVARSASAIPVKLVPELT